MAPTTLPRISFSNARTRARTVKKSKRLGLNVLGVLVALITLFPIFWMVSTAFKPSQEIYSLTPRLLPAIRRWATSRP